MAYNYTISEYVFTEAAFGCMSPSAWNYNPEADYDQGCVYPGAFIHYEQCPLESHPDDSTNYKAALKSAGMSTFEWVFSIYAGSGKANWAGWHLDDSTTIDASSLADEAALDVNQIHDSDKNTVWNSKLSQALHIPMKDLNDNRGAVITSLAGKGITATESMFEMFNGMLDGTDDSSTAITDDSLKALLQTKVNHTGTFNYVAP